MIYYDLNNTVSRRYNTTLTSKYDGKGSCAKKVTPAGHHAIFARDPLRSYFDECQKNEIHLLYLHFVFTSILFIIYEVLV